MRCETRQNTINKLLSSTPYELLGPNPSRKAILLSPVAGGTLLVPGYISLSHRANVVPGGGVLNYITGFTEPFCLTDKEIGDAIGLPWWVVSTYNVWMQVTEYSYVNLEDCKRY